MKTAFMFIQKYSLLSQIIIKINVSSIERSQMGEEGEKSMLPKKKKFGFVPILSSVAADHCRERRHSFTKVKSKTTGLRGGKNKMHNI